MSCARCNEICEEYEIGRSSDLKKAIAVILGNLNDGTIKEYAIPQRGKWQTKFSELEKGTWPDYIECFFTCTNCRQLFRLSAETYHGSGGSWSPVSEAAIRNGTL